MCDDQRNDVLRDYNATAAIVQYCFNRDGKQHNIIDATDTLRSRTDEMDRHLPNDLYDHKGGHSRDALWSFCTASAMNDKFLEADVSPIHYVASSM